MEKLTTKKKFNINQKDVKFAVATLGLVGGIAGTFAGIGHLLATSAQGASFETVVIGSVIMGAGMGLGAISGQVGQSLVDNGYGRDL